MNRILIIDDEPTIRMLLTRILELEGYEVLSAKDRVTALYTLKNNEVQVVLCDVFLPDGNQKKQHADCYMLFRQHRGSFDCLGRCDQSGP